jgi:hypothetical protein
VRVPAEAGDGKAMITLSFADWTDGKVKPMQVGVPVEAARK